MSRTTNDRFRYNRLVVSMVNATFAYLQDSLPPEFAKFVPSEPFALSTRCQELHILLWNDYIAPFFSYGLQWPVSEEKFKTKCISSLIEATEMAGHRLVVYLERIRIEETTTNLAYHIQQFFVSDYCLGNKRVKGDLTPPDVLAVTVLCSLLADRFNVPFEYKITPVDTDVSKHLFPVEYQMADTLN